MSDAMETIVPILAPGHTAAELGATPKPDELPDAVHTASIPVVDPRAESSGLTLGQVTDFTDRLATIVFGCSEGARGPYAYFVDIEADLGTLLQDMRDAVEEAAPVPSTSHVLYTVRWDDGVLHAAKNTIREAQEVLSAGDCAGVIVQRTVTTTAWTEVAS
jgi:hypothetical protein